VRSDLSIERPVTRIVGSAGDTGNVASLVAFDSQ